MKFATKLTMIGAAVAMSMGTAAIAQDKVAVFATNPQGSLGYATGLAVCQDCNSQD